MPAQTATVAVFSPKCMSGLRSPGSCRSIDELCDLSRGPVRRWALPLDHESHAELRAGERSPSAFAKENLEADHAQFRSLIADRLFFMDVETRAATAVRRADDLPVRRPGRTRGAVGKRRGAIRRGAFSGHLRCRRPEEVRPGACDAAYFLVSCGRRDFCGRFPGSPDCAMAYWGLAATAIGSLYGGRPGPMASQGEIAVEKAKAIGGKTSRERDYIAAIEVFYRGAGKIDYATRVRAYANALEQLHRKYPDDREAEIFYAYALSALGSPTDQTFAYQLKGAAILEKLLVELPNHPGVIHYLLHAYDNAPHASRGLAAAVVCPRSHLRRRMRFNFRLKSTFDGPWQESIDTNRAGAAVEELFFKPHAMDFLYSYLQTGQDAAAKRIVDEAATITILPHILDAYAMAAMPARYAIERRNWSEAASLTLPQSEFAWSHFPHAEATLVFARALGAARSDSIDAARKDLDRYRNCAPT